MKPYSQTDNWSCLAMSAAHIAGDENLESFIEYACHDGSMFVQGSTHPDGRMGFILEEARGFLASRGIELVEITTEDYPQEPAALLSVAVPQWPMNSHWIAWSGGEHYEPHPRYKGREFTEYPIVSAWAARRRNP
ncbi:MAG: hypothetical protein P1V51_20140 [Deltaproteobacteria bacterium]|nr:hypothetical protein [Deltaproteobacteria bacterium]